MNRRTVDAPEQGRRAELADVGVLIPVWKPPSGLPELVEALLARSFGRVVIVDDGSSRQYEQLFNHLKAMPSVHVVHHTRNQGKGRALKTGLSFLGERFPELIGVVTADADGQHLPKDIERVGLRLLGSGDRCVLGVRTFDRKAPLKNGLANRLTAMVFRMVTGCKVSDTQTGLRGVPRSLWTDLLGIPGERYEYETAVLVELCRSGRPPIEVPIETVYLNRNRSSHFRPFHDSLQIYRTLFRAVLRFKPEPCRR